METFFAAKKRKAIEAQEEKNRLEVEEERKYYDWLPYKYRDVYQKLNKPREYFPPNYPDIPWAYLLDKITKLEDELKTIKKGNK